MILTAVLASCISATTLALPSATQESFDVAETHTYMQRFLKQGAAGKIVHTRTPLVIVPGQPQDVVRMNRDTLYSWAVLDLRNCEATITFPKSDGRFVSLNRISEQHDTWPSIYEPGKYVFTKENSGGFDYHILNLRIFADPDDPKDIAAVNSYQDQFVIHQACDGSKPEIPEWDQDSLSQIRGAFETLFKLSKDQTSENMFGMVKDLHPLRHMMAVAIGWGGLMTQDTIYQAWFPEKQFADGKKLMTLSVPADKEYFVKPGFWSITMYDSKAMMYDNPASINHVTATANKDGSYTINFGGCENANRINCLPLTSGWNYVARMYRPAPGITKKDYAFPTPVASKKADGGEL